MNSWREVLDGQRSCPPSTWTKVWWDGRDDYAQEMWVPTVTHEDESKSYYHEDNHRHREEDVRTPGEVTDQYAICGLHENRVRGEFPRRARYSKSSFTSRGRTDSRFHWFRGSPQRVCSHDETSHYAQRRGHRPRNTEKGENTHLIFTSPKERHSSQFQDPDSAEQNTSTTKTENQKCDFTREASHQKKQKTQAQNELSAKKDKKTKPDIEVTAAVSRMMRTSYNLTERITDTLSHTSLLLGDFVSHLRSYRSEGNKIPEKGLKHLEKDLMLAQDLVLESNSLCQGVSCTHKNLIPLFNNLRHCSRECMQVLQPYLVCLDELTNKDDLLPQHVTHYITGTLSFVGHASQFGQPRHHSVADYAMSIYSDVMGIKKESERFPRRLRILLNSLKTLLTMLLFKSSTLEDPLKMTNFLKQIETLAYRWKWELDLPTERYRDNSSERVDFKRELAYYSQQRTTREQGQDERNNNDLPLNGDYRANEQRVSQKKSGSVSRSSVDVVSGQARSKKAEDRGRQDDLLKEEDHSSSKPRRKCHNIDVFSSRKARQRTTHRRRWEDDEPLSQGEKGNQKTTESRDSPGHRERQNSKPKIRYIDFDYMPQEQLQHCLQRPREFIDYDELFQDTKSTQPEQSKENTREKASTQQESAQNTSPKKECAQRQADRQEQEANCSQQSQNSVAKCGENPYRRRKKWYENLLHFPIWNKSLKRIEYQGRKELPEFKVYTTLRRKKKRKTTLLTNISNISCDNEGSSSSDDDDDDDDRLYIAEPEEQATLEVYDNKDDKSSSHSTDGYSAPQVEEERICEKNRGVDDESSRSKNETRFKEVTKDDDDNDGMPTNEACETITVITLSENGDLSKARADATVPLELQDQDTLCTVIQDDRNSRSSIKEGQKNRPGTASSKTKESHKNVTPGEIRAILYQLRLARSRDTSRGKR
ncbi:uncharacterized protein LOC143039216 [Oratosquilla oratoria]|uniref:uncharacterized protein LOC143039216 n=1 Tax=Oratosquilla oratoria TaxID=337810 RepID=UPI003F76FACF